MARTDPQINIRVTTEFKKKLEITAIERGRSLNAEVVRRLEQSFIDSIPDESIPSMIGAYLLGIYSRYSEERDELLKQINQNQNNKELKDELSKYDFLISELRSNIERLIHNAFAQSINSPQHKKP